MTRRASYGHSGKVKRHWAYVVGEWSPRTDEEFCPCTVIIVNCVSFFCTFLSHYMKYSLSVVFFVARTPHIPPPHTHITCTWLSLVSLPQFAASDHLHSWQKWRHKYSHVTADGETCTDRILYVVLYGFIFIYRGSQQVPHLTVLFLTYQWLVLCLLGLWSRLFVCMLPCHTTVPSSVQSGNYTWIPIPPTLVISIQLKVKLTPYFPISLSSWRTAWLNVFLHPKSVKKALSVNFPLFTHSGAG